MRPVFMIDYSSRNLVRASSRLRNAKLIRADISRVPFEDDCFDCVVVIRVLHHFSDPRIVLDEVCRVARNGATVILGVPNPRLGRYMGVPTKMGVIFGPQGHRSYVHSPDAYSGPRLREVSRRGLGSFDNHLTRRLSRLIPLSKLDTLTSPAWKLKPELFIKLRVEKEDRGEREPIPLCTCHGSIVEGVCRGCGRAFGQIIDLVRDENEAAD